MYYVSWKLNFKQIIQIDHESFILQKGVYFPKQEWRWQTSQVVVIDTPSKYRLSPTKLTLKHLNQTVQIGDFLNREEKKTPVYILYKDTFGKMSKELNEQQNATVGMTVGVIEVRFRNQRQPSRIQKNNARIHCHDGTLFSSFRHSWHD